MLKFLRRKISSSVTVYQANATGAVLPQKNGGGRFSLADRPHPAAQRIFDPLSRAANSLLRLLFALAWLDGYDIRYVIGLLC